MVVNNMSLETQLFKRNKYSSIFIGIFEKNNKQYETIDNDQLKQLSKEEIHSIAEQNYQLGVEAGIKQATKSATETARNNFDNELNILNSIVDQIKCVYAQSEEKILDDVIRLSLAIAQKITHTHLTLNTEAVIPIVNNAIEMLPSRAEEYEIRLNPLDATRIQEHLIATHEKLRLNIASDKSIELGGAIVMTATNQINATNEQRWKKIYMALGADHQWLKD